jgi:hypothetical protein
MTKQTVFYALILKKGKQTFVKTYKTPTGAKGAKEEYLKNGFTVNFKILTTK